MLTNYHTHNELCGHAGGALEDYVTTAISHHFTELGMSDHTPFPDDSQGCRMPYSKLDYYVSETRRLQSAYQGQLSIRLGGEIEYVPEQLSYYDELFEKWGFEYLLMAGHNFRNRDGKYLNCYNDITCTQDFADYADFVNLAMNTGMFAYLAHPDLPFMKDVPLDDNIRYCMSAIVENAVKHDHILELNANGFRRQKMESQLGLRYQYPFRPFWEEVAKTNIRVMIGADCHSTDALCDWATDEADAWCRELGLNLIEKLPL